VGCENRRKEVNLSVYRKKGRVAMKLGEWKRVESRLIYELIETSWELISSIIKE